jgi:hypothetical protein
MVESTTEELRIGQICYVINNWMICNFVVRNNKKVESKTGGKIAFPLGGGKKQAKPAEKKSKIKQEKTPIMSVSSNKN